MTTSAPSRVGVSNPTFTPPAFELLQPGEPNYLPIKLAEAIGIRLLDWQQHVLSNMCARDPATGLWAARETLLLVPRQCGKTVCLLIRMLAGALLFNDRRILFSAHEHRTSIATFRDLVDMIENSSMLKAQVARVWASTVEQRILFVNGAEIKLIARTSNAGRGLRPDLIVLDEAFSVPEEMLLALVPSQVARPNPQLAWASSAGDQNSLELLKMRARLHSGADPQLTGWEWMAPVEADIKEPATWAMANPSMPAILNERALRGQLIKLTPAGFRREHLGQWSEVVDERVFEPDDIASAAIPGLPAPTDTSTLAFGIEVAQIGTVRTQSTVAAAWKGEDGIPIISVIKSDAGAEWLIEYLKALAARYPGVPLVYDSKSPGKDLFDRLRILDEVEMTALSYREYVTACAGLVQAITAKRLRVCVEPAGLTTDMAAAKQKVVGGDWIWQRSTSAPPAALIAATVALYTTELTDLGAPEIK